MKCKFCGSEWRSASKVRTCPFCGEDLAEPPVFSAIEPALRYILDTYGEQINKNPNRLVAYLGDLAPRLADERRLLKLCAEAGIIAELLAVTEQAERELAARRAVMLLSSTHFVDMKWAETAVGWLTSAAVWTDPAAAEAPASRMPPEEKEKPRIQKRREELMKYSGRLACGYSHILGLRSDGTVVAYGKNDFGQCNVGDWRDITAIVCGHRVSVGLTADHTTLSTNLSGARYPWQNTVQIGALTDYPVALCADGRVRCGKYIWGLGQSHEPYCRKCRWVNGAEGDISELVCRWDMNFFLLSDGTVAACHPGKFDEGVRYWQNVASVVTHDAVYGLRADGWVYAQGSNKSGKCDVDSWRGIVDIAAGPRNVVGLRADGSVACAGEDAEMFQAVQTWTDIAAVACGGQFVAGLRADGTVVTCGWKVDLDTSGWRDIVAIICGTAYIAGLQADGTVVCEGLAFFGEDRIAGQNLFR